MTLQEKMKLAKQHIAFIAMGLSSVAEKQAALDELYAYGNTVLMQDDAARVTDVSIKAPADQTVQ
jgi:hypothetical protein